MKPFRFFIYLVALTMTLSLAGCGQKENPEHGHDSEKGEGKEEEGHGHEDSSSGASFKPGKGVILSEETRTILGLATVDVTEEKLPQVVRFNVQIFGETHRFAHENLDHTGCDVHGSGFLPPDRAVLIKPKQQVKLLTAFNETMDGFVVVVQEKIAQGETEIVVGVTGAGSKLKDGDFVQATISLSREDAVTVIPRTALLRTSQGTFVYVVNGNAYSRTAVKVGTETDDKIEITDGLFSGDQVVTKPVETLWLIELRATKGGGHSH